MALIKNKHHTFIENRMLFVFVYEYARACAGTNNAPTHDAPQREYVYFDGERLYLDDERIYNIIDVSSDSGRNLRFPLFSRFVPFSSQPTVTRVFALSGDTARQADVYMNNRRVSALRYAQTVGNRFIHRKPDVFGDNIFIHKLPPSGWEFLFPWRWT